MLKEGAEHVTLKFLEMQGPQGSMRREGSHLLDQAFWGAAAKRDQLQLRNVGIHCRGPAGKARGGNGLRDLGGLSLETP